MFGPPPLLPLPPPPPLPPSISRRGPNVKKGAKGQKAT